LTPDHGFITRQFAVIYAQSSGATIAHVAGEAGNARPKPSRSLRKIRHKEDARSKTAALHPPTRAPRQKTKKTPNCHAAPPSLHPVAHTAIHTILPKEALRLPISEIRRPFPTRDRDKKPKKRANCHAAPTLSCITSAHRNLRTILHNEAPPPPTRDPKNQKSRPTVTPSQRRPHIPQSDAQYRTRIPPPLHWRGVNSASRIRHHRRPR
jgi:hypothetical protein